MSFALDDYLWLTVRCWLRRGESPASLPREKNVTGLRLVKATAVRRENRCAILAALTRLIAGHGALEHRRGILPVDASRRPQDAP